MKEFISIDAYILLSREERRKHLILNDQCIEIGGDSRNFKGLLSYHLCTTMGHGNIFLCHACNNEKCSNPNHLYWGTPKDNTQDYMKTEKYKSVYQHCIDKYGIEETKKICKKAAANANKSKRKSKIDHFTDETKRLWEQAIKNIDVMKFGWVSLFAKRFHISTTHVRRIMRKNFPDVKRFERKVRPARLERATSCLEGKLSNSS
jgi:hypothetical protein